MCMCAQSMAALAEESRQNFSKIGSQVKFYEDAMYTQELELKHCKEELRQTKQSLEKEQIQNKHLDMLAEQHEFLSKEMELYKQRFSSLKLENGLTGADIMKMSIVSSNIAAEANSKEMVSVSH